MTLPTVENIATYPLDKIPFRFMRELLRYMQVIAINSVQTLDKPDPLLLARLKGGVETTKALKNPLRGEYLGHIIGWYGLLKEVQTALPAGALADKLNEFMTAIAWVGALKQDVEAKKAQGK